MNSKKKHIENEESFDKTKKVKKDENKTKQNEDEVEKLKSQLETVTKKCDDYLLGLQRSVAEFDNYKKRIIREKECIYTDTTGDIITALLPVLDNLERAIGSVDDSDHLKPFKEGVIMVQKQFVQILKDFGVEEIECIGEEFDPELHEAVMHVEDEKIGENIVVEQVQKGYKIKNKVIRHSLVKVAN